MAGDLKLPACEKCRVRKVKCDTKAPKCTSCEKTHSACIIIDPVSHEKYSRQALFELEEKLNGLEARRKTDRVLPPNDASVEHPFIGPASGLGFLKHLFSTADWLNAQADLVQHLNVRAPLPETQVPLHPLPSFEYTQDILNEYFTRPHVQHPYIPRKTAHDIVQRIYQKDGDKGCKQDYYRLFMLLAIGSVSKYRQKHIREHPYGFFKAAQQYIPLWKLGTVDGIQNILLLARFAAYCHVKCSIWDMSQFCMRQCIELGLHKRSRKPLPPYKEQLNRRVFWTCYVQDRYSSAILGRPFAISDREITQPLPCLADDEDILSSNEQRLDDIQPIQRSTPSEMAVFLFIIGLRRITGRIHKAFYTRASRGNGRHTYQISDAGYAYNEAQQLLSELDAQQRQAPVFTHPRCMYEHSDWHVFFTTKDRLILTRGAISRMSLSGLHPAQDLLHACLEYATVIIDLYSKLHAQGFVTWTRSYFQIMFTAGMSIMFSLSVLRLNCSRKVTPEVKAGMNALTSCGRVLFGFLEDMPDASRFALVFEALRKKCLADQEDSPDVKAIIDAEQLKTKSLRPLYLVPPAQTLSSGPGVVVSNPEPRPPEVVHDSAEACDPIQGRPMPDFQYRGHPFQFGNPAQANVHHLQQASFDPGVTVTDGAGPSITDPAELSQWPVFDEDLFGHMEAGIGEFASGDPQADVDMWQELFSGVSGQGYT